MATPAPRTAGAINARRVLGVVLLAYAGFSTVLMVQHTVGLTSEHALLILLALFTLFGRARPFVWDWLPFLGVGVMFTDLGTMVGKNVADAHTLLPIDIEQHLLGGNVAALWLQQNVRPALPWLDGILAAVYLSFFLAPLAMGLWLWLRRRTVFGVFVAAYVAMSAVGFAVYVLFPETPPWLAAQLGALPPLDRITVTALGHLGPIGSLYSHADPAPYGAMPALHVALPTLIASAAIATSTVHRRVRWLWLLYPALMFLAVLYLGEHYLLDAVCGAALGAGAYWLAQVLRLRLDRRHGTGRGVTTSSGPDPLWRAA